MGFLKDPLPAKARKRPRKRAKPDLHARVQQAIAMIADTSLTSLEIVNPKFTVRIKKS